MCKIDYAQLSDEDAARYDRMMFKRDRYRYFSQEVNDRVQRKNDEELRRLLNEK